MPAVIELVEANADTVLELREAAAPNLVTALLRQPGQRVAQVEVQVKSRGGGAEGERFAVGGDCFRIVLGVGMAIPWPVAGAGIAALPRPGAWMVRIKQVFGVVILALFGVQAFYGFVLYRRLPRPEVPATGPADGEGD